MTKTIWISTSAATTYVPREKPIQESLAPFSSTFSGAVPSTQIRADNTGQRILAIDGTWIPQPAFTSGGSDQIETLRPSVISPSYSANPPTVTDSAKAYDSDTNHATTFGQWYAAQEARTNNRVDIFSLTTWASKTQTWTAATINVSRSYAILQDGESSATSGSSSKTSSVKYEFSTNNGSSWTTLGTDTQSSIPTAPQTLSMALGTLTPTMGNILVKVTITRGGGGTIFEDGVSLPGLTGEVDLKLFDVWIDGTYAGGAGNITCNNLTVTGDATFQNKIYDSTASAGTTGQVLKVAANGKVTWATDSAGTGTVTSITTTGANGVTISGGSTQTITTSGTFALALGNITPTSISTGTGSFSGDVEFAASIKSPNGSNSPVTIVPDGTGDLHVNADSLRLGDNNADATIATNGTGDLILTTHEGSATQGIIRLYDGANGNITLTPNGTGQVQVGSDQVVTLIASQTLTNKTLSTSSTWNGNVIGSAYGGAGTVNGILKANGSGTVSAASAGTDYVTSVSVTSPVSNTGTTANPTIALASGYGDTQNPYASKTANYFLASPNGTAGSPTFRAIVAADIPTLNQSTTGNAATASALQTARNINGVSFNGTADITVTAAANTLTGTTLASGVIASSLTSVGTLGSLTVSGTTSLATSSGLVGIGTASPAFKLHTYIASGTSMFRFESGSNTGIYGYWTRPNQSYIQALNLDNNGDKDFSLYDATNGQVADRYYPSSTGYRAFFTNGSERMRIDSSGRVGIGSTSPSARLHINVSSTSSNQFKVYSNDVTPQLRTYTTSDGDGLIINQYWAVAGSPYLRSVDFVASMSDVSSTMMRFFTKDFSSNPTERMRIDSSGNLLVGVTSASYSSANRGVAILGGSASGLLGFQIGGVAKGYVGHFDSSMDIWNEVASPIKFGTSATERMRLDATGNLGVGTASPSEKLSIKSATGINSVTDIASLTNPSQTSAGVRVLFNNGYGNLGAISSFQLDNGAGADNGVLAFQTASDAVLSTKMTILDTGNVGIGVTSPSAKLQVNSSGNTPLNLVGSTACQINLNDGTQNANWGLGVGGVGITGIASPSTYPLVMYTNGSERMRIDSSGNVLIGNTNGTEKLTVTGNIRASGVYVGNGSTGSYTKGFGAIQTASTTPGTPSGGAAGDHFYYY